MELNREQIIMVLECFIQTGEGCYFYKPGGLREEFTPADIATAALALIRELTEENEKIGIENFNLICELSRIKADTVRKMQDRLKNAFNFGHTILEKSICDIIDQIAKELLEDNT